MSKVVSKAKSGRKPPARRVLVEEFVDVEMTAIARCVHALRVATDPSVAGWGKQLHGTDVERVLAYLSSRFGDARRAGVVNSTAGGGR